jgi:hypothetical protein
LTISSETSNKKVVQVIRLINRRKHSNFKPDFVIIKMSHGRRSGGKRIRMDESPPSSDFPATPLASGGGASVYGQQYDSFDQQGSGYEEPAEDAAFDPMAFYKAQQQEMLLQASQHVQASQVEIQEAQRQAQEADQEVDTEARGGRRGRHAAAAAKAAMSMMSESDR